MYNLIRLDQEAQIRIKMKFRNVFLATEDGRIVLDTILDDLCDNEEAENDEQIVLQNYAKRLKGYLDMITNNQDDRLQILNSIFPFDQNRYTGIKR